MSYIFSDANSNSQDCVCLTLHLAAINHYGPVVLTSELLPLLVATPNSRLIMVASNGHKRVASARALKRNLDSEEGKMTS